MTASSLQTSHDPRAGTVIGVLAIPPVLFLLVTVGFAIYYGSQGADPKQIAERTQAAAPWILVAVQVSLLGLVLLLSRTAGGLGWKMPADRRVGTELAIGAGCGAVLGLIYVFGLASVLTSVQRSLGDYVPPGSVLPSIGHSLWPFFVADVVLAPFVEESIYRGWATSRLLLRFGAFPTSLIVCSMFGALHWAGGIWYVLLVGFVAGGLFIALRLLRRNLAAPFGAHFGLNAVEYLFVLLSH